MGDAAAVGDAAADGGTVGEGDGVGDGVDEGGSGGVGQLASAGLNGVAEGVAVGLGVGAPGDGVAVTTYGVNEGQLASGGVGGACAPATISEMATATAPTRTVATNVTAPHSRLRKLTPDPRREPPAVRG